ncbi:MAG: FG-GAP repeat domain-containing protein, partial [Alphaproteobacteria bacterium]
MRRIIGVAAAVLMAVTPTVGMADQEKPAKILVVALPGLEEADAQIAAGKGDTFFLVRPDGSRLHYRWAKGKILATGKPVIAPPVRPAGALPDAVVTRGANHIARTWLAQPTKRYGHGILGDTIEAGALVVEATNGRLAKLVLDENSVFEDLAPRLGDVTGDGRDEVVTMRTTLRGGAALFVARFRKGKLEKLTEGPNFGRPSRWLDPAGIADFTGDGHREIAVVTTPHIGGTLQLWSVRGTRLVKLVAVPGFSNHAIGSRVLDNSAVADFDGDGIVDIAVPSANRRTLRLASLRG